MNYNARVELLILDDFLLHTITDEREIKVLFELLEKRSEFRKSTIICSQRETKSWASMMLNDEVSSNAILKRATKHYVIVINPKNNDYFFPAARLRLTAAGHRTNGRWRAPNAKGEYIQTDFAVADMFRL